jgi:hypothetical protein
MSISKRVSQACLLASAPLALVLLGACGGSGGSGTPEAAGGTATAGGALDAAFAQRVEAVCAPYAAYNAGHLLGVRGFSRYAPDPDQLPRVAAFLERNPSYRTLASDLEDLGEPETGAAGWRAMVADVRADTALVHRMARSARAADDAAFADVVDRVETALSAFHADLRELGLPTGSSCTEVQADPLRTSTSMH